MNAFAIANQPPMIPFLWRAVYQARIPDQRHRKGTSVHEIDRERIVGHGYGLCFSRLDFNR